MQGLMGYIFPPRSRALIYCHRNANACKKRQTPTASTKHTALHVPSVHKMTRDPYPFPRLQNDGDFCGQQGKQVKPENCSNLGGLLCFWNQVVARRFVPNKED